MRTSSILAALLLATASTLHAQTPVNDECSGALAIPVNGTPVEGTLVPATPSAVSTNNCSYSSARDLWYRFTAAEARQVIRVRAVSPTGDMTTGIQVYSGSCGALVPLAAGCASHYLSVTEGVNVSRLNVGGLTVGDTYYVRLSYGFEPAPFRVGVYNEPPVPGCVSLLAPANGATNVNYGKVETFRWTAAAGAARYQLVLTPSSGQPIRFETTDTFYNAALPAAGSWTWSVRAVNALDGEATGCTTATFSTCAAVPNPVTIAHPGYNAFCEGSFVKLTASASNPAQQWFYNNAPVPGATADTIRANCEGQYSLRLLGADGCYGDHSNYLSTFVIPLPTKPVVTTVGPSDICSGAPVTLKATPMVNAQWHRNGAPISFAYSDTYSATTAGSYFVKTTGTTGGCVNYSDTLVVGSFSTPPTPGITASGNVLSVVGGYAYYQWTRDGQVIAGATGPEFTALENGSYQARIGNSPSCTAVSPAFAFTLTALPVLTLDGSTVQLYPNPVRDVLTVDVQAPARAGRYQLSLVDGQGRRLKTVALRAGINRVPVTGLPAGLYHVLLQEGGETRSVRLLLAR